jgi:hypothetical protein
MTPFNHSLALQGASVTTRSGKEVKQLTWFEGTGVWCGEVECEVLTWWRGGNYRSDRESELDLFMSDQPAPAVKKYDRVEIAAKMNLVPEEPSQMFATLIMGSLPPAENSTKLVAWWIEAEAKYRLMKADALINELNKEKQ